MGSKVLKQIGVICTCALLWMDPCLADQSEYLAIRPADLERQLQVGDVVFIHIPVPPFTQIAKSTQSWTNHVGIVTSTDGGSAIISESRFPLSGSTTFEQFARRSEQGRVAVGRLPESLTPVQVAQLQKAAADRDGIFYDAGFNLQSKRQFCSRYVREVLHESTGIELGQVETFSDLLSKNPSADLALWKIWFLGNIPWNRKTVTPASQLRDPQLHLVFDGQVS